MCEVSKKTLAHNFLDNVKAFNASIAKKNKAYNNILYHIDTPKHFGFEYLHTLFRYSDGAKTEIYPSLFLLPMTQIRC